MALTKPKNWIDLRVQVTKEELEFIDEMAAAMGLTRSQFVRPLLSDALRDWRILSRVGVTPRRMQLLGEALHRMGFEVDPDDKLVFRPKVLFGKAPRKKVNLEGESGSSA
jgi:hypothetical protein